MNNNKKKYIQIVVLILFIVLIGVMTYLAIPIIKSLPTEDGRIFIQQRVESFGIFAPVFYILFCIFQVIIAIVPGEPIEIMGGILFGPLWGSIFCIIGSALGMILVYYLVKIIGKPLLDVVVNNRKFSKLKILNDQKKLELLVFALFLIPGTPKDALTYFVPLTKIEPRKYFIYANLARIPSIVSSTIIGATLSDGNFFYSVIITIITVTIALIGIFFNEKLMKRIKEKHKNKKK